MSETTRRQFLETTATAAAAAVLVPSALVAGRPALARAQSPLPVGPGAPYSSYQSEIYISGMATSIEPRFTTNLSDLEAAAAKVLPEAARRHLLAEAGGAPAARANTRALRAWRIVPRMFIDREERDLSTTVLGAAMAAPIILGPVGAQRMAHGGAEGASAKAAAGLGLTYVHSSRASAPLEGVAVAAPTGSRWFALDWPSGAPDRALLGRAQTSGYTHLVLSAPQPGKGFGALAAVEAAWDGPIVLGGIQTVADAQKAVRLGFDGILISNERGRRGAEPIGTIDVLPPIVEAVGGKVPILFGSGVRTGTDVYRALALGADAVFINRPYVYALALAGEPGVRHMLRSLLAELDITLAIASDGPSLADLDPSALVRN